MMTVHIKHGFKRDMQIDDTKHFIFFPPSVEMCVCICAKKKSNEKQCIERTVLE